MPQRMYFTGQTIKWLEAKRALLLDELASGRVLTSVLATGVRTEEVVQQSASTALRRIEHDLSILDPKKYPPASVAPIKRVRPSYLFS